MPAHVIERTSRDFVPVLAAEQGDLERDAFARDDLRRRIVSLLRTRGVPKAEALEVEVNGRTVTVRGRLPDRHAKWLCLECCRHVAGVLKLIDNVEVEASLQKDAAQDTDEQIDGGATGALPGKPR